MSSAILAQAPPLSVAEVVDALLSGRLAVALEEEQVPAEVAEEDMRCCGRLDTPSRCSAKVPGNCGERHVRRGGCVSLTHAACPSRKCTLASLCALHNMLQARSCPWQQNMRNGSRGSLSASSPRTSRSLYVVNHKGRKTRIITQALVYAQ